MTSQQNQAAASEISFARAITSALRDVVEPLRGTRDVSTTPGVL